MKALIHDAANDIARLTIARGESFSCRKVVLAPDGPAAAAQGPGALV
jgi:hypothetical protein